MPKDRITILRNREIYPSYEVAVAALNRYVETNSLLDGEPVLGRYYDNDGNVKTLFGVCAVLERDNGCITKEILNFINNEAIIMLLKKIAYTGEASDVSYDNGYSLLDANNVQEALDEICDKIGVAMDNFSTADEVAGKSISITSQRSDTKVVYQGTEYTNLSLFDDDHTSKTDITYTQEQNGETYTVTSRVNSLDVEELYQKTSNTIILCCGSSSEVF